VKIDLLYEIQIPLPHGPTTERDYFWQALAQVEAADRAGFGCAWAVEHHFLTEFAHSSAPEVFLTACSMRTERIRVGHGVALLPQRFNHPIRVAERAATLDTDSEGRLEFGTGRFSPYEQEGFEVPTALSWIARIDGFPPLSQILPPQCRNGLDDDVDGSRTPLVTVRWRCLDASAGRFEFVRFSNVLFHAAPGSLLVGAFSGCAATGGADCPGYPSMSWTARIDGFTPLADVLPPPPLPEPLCSNGRDDDGDGRTDAADAHCKSDADNDESRP
jgi:hypothetical protein